MGDRQLWPIVLAALLTALFITYCGMMGRSVSMVFDTASLDPPLQSR